MLFFTAFLAGAMATLELTPKNFDEVVHESGKGTFIKFLAPWCGHCKNMKPDWDKLANKFKSSDVVTIADVDCTAAGEPLCQRVGVKGYPTIKYWLAGNKSAKDYQGGRDYNSLESFTMSTFKAACDPLTEKGCNDQEKRYIEKVKPKSAEELATEQKEKETELKTVKDERKAAEKEFKEKEKALKRKEKALTKAVTIVKKFIKEADKKKDEL